MLYIKCINLQTTSGVTAIQWYVAFCLILTIYKVPKNSNKCLLLLSCGFPDKNVIIYLSYSN